MTSPILELTGISKGYGGLRPLRIERLIVPPADRVAILGFDRPMAEVFVNLVTGAALPDHGTVAVFGRPTSAITDPSEWLTLVDRFGIVSDRVVLLEGMTAIQNLALPYTLEIEPPEGEARNRAEQLAKEVGLSESTRNVPIAELDDLGRASVRLARAMALEPALLLLEHATSSIDPSRVAEYVSRLDSVLAGRAVTAVAMTADEQFAEMFSGRALRLDPASGKLGERAARGWFGRAFRR